MARVAQLPVSLRTGAGVSSNDQELSAKPSKHKVVLESVTQEKKKLRSVLSFKAEPPKGYTFIPAGNPELTNALKEFARKGNYEIYAVSTTPHQRAHDLSQQVHRIGFHFPSVVVAQVCAHYGIVLTSAGTVLAEDESQSFHPRSKRLKEQAAAQDRKDQITINTEARDTIRDLFPNIPDNDLNQIIKTAFQKGQGKVGTANELSLIRRAQLAVVAHIRHVYTDYDKLLRQTHYRDARNLVEKPSLRRLVEWRGDDENGKQVLEDVFREVVVISDDEDSGEEEDQTTNYLRDVSIEIVSSNTTADHFNPDPLAPEGPAISHRTEASHFTNSNRSSDYQYISVPSRKERISDKDKASRRGFSRYQVWNEAREEYRANPTNTLVDANQRALPYSAPKMSVGRPDEGPGGPRPRPEPFRMESRKSSQHQDVSIYSHSDAPDIFRAEDGTLYERVVKYPSTASLQPPTRLQTSETHRGAAADKVKSFPVADSTHFRSTGSGLGSQRDTILPSIEGPPMAAAFSPIQAVDANHSPVTSANERRAIATQSDRERHVDDIEFLDLTGDNKHLKKRRRIDNVGPDIPKFARTSALAQTLPSQQPAYISLLSPTDQYSHLRDSNALSPSRHQGFHDHSNASYLMPTCRETREIDSPAGITQASERLMARPPAGRLSSLSHFRSQEDPYSPTSSPRRDGECMLSRLQPASSAGAISVDRGIQEYRAFRARERQEKTLRSPTGRGRPQLYENGDPTNAAVGSRKGSQRPFARSELSSDSSHHFPSKGLVRDSLVVDDPVSLVRDNEYRLTRERAAGRDHPLRRRSASPLQNPRSRLSYDVPSPRSHLQGRYEKPVEYVSVAWDRLAQRGERVEPVGVVPTVRYEREMNTAPQYLPIHHGEGEPRSANSQRRSYAQL